MSYTTLPNETALILAREQTRDNHDRLVEFVNESKDSTREPSDYLLEISNQELIRVYLLNERVMNAIELKAAVLELRRRFYARWEEVIQIEAEEIQKEDDAQVWAERTGVFA